ncbi:carbohydrate ABC transporter permease [Rhodobacteraceae bacterium N5(2021)]|uniref:sn-glycerol-3-phosphate transport system permease protein UgpE n=1 Tax=Gymnodinialimonas phycosphaerae TaxID=2841589 RepID=A0A975YEE9_9RHOB|nr:carbohydrate ABC transporter permease [Gymnodinialimonas phycosphaerae]MBY4893526.1 carbohydrate ABC transporter permease [Gymnodinialimonas phycosphaerae]
MATIESAAGVVVTPSERGGMRAPLRVLFLGFLALVVLYPLWEIARISFLNPVEVNAADARFWPPTFRAYVEAWTGVSFPRYFINSVVVTLAVTLGSTVTAILAAYAFARAEFRGRDLLFLAVIGTLMIPNHITLIPNYLTFARFNLLNTFVCLIVPFLASGFSVFFLRQHMLTIPRALDESARMDGASTGMILRTIIVPLSWPAIAVVALFAFMGQWNEFIWPLLATTSDDMRTIQIGLRYLLRDQEGALPDWPLVMAGTMITLVPLLIAYAVAERHLIRGITMGSFR